MGLPEPGQRFRRLVVEPELIVLLGEAERATVGVPSGLMAGLCCALEPLKEDLVVFFEFVVEDGFHAQIDQGLENLAGDQ